MNLLLLAVAAGALAQAPIRAGGPVSQAVLAVNLDGAPAAVASAGDALVALRLDGRPVPGFPVALGDAGGAPAAADVDGDGRPELAVATASGAVFLVGRGGVLPGWPVKLGAAVRAGVAFADVDGDGRPEVVVGDAEGRLHALLASGAEAEGFPLSLGAAVTSPASSGRLAGGDTLAVGCADGKVHAIALPARRERRGFPLVTGYEVTGAPAFADLDEDGAPELVVASQDFSVYAVSGKGEPLAGWPVTAGYRVYGGALVADLDGDGRPDVAFASADGAVHAVSAAGRPLAGYPARLGGKILSAPIAADVDGDGKPELVVLAADGALHALRAGKELAGFPRRLGALGAPGAEAGEGASGASASPAAAEGALAVGLPTGELHLLRAGRAAASPWPMAGRDPARTASVAPTALRFEGVAVEPAVPVAGERLLARYRVVGPGDAAAGAAAAQVEWLRDGAPVPELRGRAEVPAGVARKGQRWSFTVSRAGARDAAASGAVTVGDSPPGTPRVALDPERPAAGAPVRVRILAPATDPDGDRVEHEVEWLVDGALVPGQRGDALPGELVRGGAWVAARVTATDGELRGAPAVAEARVGGGGPAAPTVRLGPAAPGAGDAIVAQASAPGGGKLQLRFRWRVGAEALPVSWSAARLEPGAARKHQRVRVEVRSFDGEQEGPPAADEVEVRDSAPTAPVVEIQPAAPRGGEPLRAVVVKPAVDADGDAVTYRYQWRRRGELLRAPGDGRELPGALVRKGDLVELAVTATDGELEGPAGRAEARVGNTPPSAPRIAIEPAVPRAGEPVKVVIVEPARDPDGDELSYGVSWSRDGRPLAAVGELLARSEVRQGARLRAIVVARDGDDAGPPAVAEVRVASEVAEAPAQGKKRPNAPPGAPGIAIEPAEPTAETGLTAAIRAPARDPDGDPVTYRYSWLRDGQPAGVDAAAVPARLARRGELWTVVVRAFDGQAEGPTATASARVGAPRPPRVAVALRPEQPVAGQALACEVRPLQRGAGGERPEVRTRWLRNGQPSGVADGRLELPALVTRRGERWTCEAWAADGAAEGEPARASQNVRNSPPSEPRLAIEPERPRRGDALFCRLTAPSRDLDGDPVRYAWAWWRNDQPAQASGPELPAGIVKKGERWRCAATPSDGELAGPQGRADVRVGNTPPGAPRARLVPAAPAAGEPLRCEVAEPAADADGDALKYAYAWWRNGEEQGFAPGTAEVPARLVRAGERWRCTIAANDGEATGPAGSSLEVVVAGGK